MEFMVRTKTGDRGPFPRAKILDLIERGKLDPERLIKCVGTGRLIRAADAGKDSGVLEAIETAAGAGAEDAWTRLDKQAKVAANLSVYIFLFLVVLGFVLVQAAPGIVATSGVALNTLGVLGYGIGMMASLRCLFLAKALGRRSLLFGGLIFGLLNGGAFAMNGYCLLGELLF